MGPLKWADFHIRANFFQTHLKHTFWMDAEYQGTGVFLGVAEGFGEGSAVWVGRAP